MEKPDKGKALVKLKKLLKINDDILYLGDSENDNNTFEKSDVSIGVTRNEVKPHLDCQYLVPFDKMNITLKKLFKTTCYLIPTY